MINVQREIKAMSNMCNTVGLSLRFLEEGDKQPWTDMIRKIVYVPLPRYSWNQHEINEWRSLAWHEVGHHHPSQAELIELMISQEIASNSPLGTLINCIDDVWQERITTMDYPGAGRTLSYGQGCAIKTGIRAIKESGVGEFPPSLVKGLQLAYAARRSWQPDVQDALPELEALIGGTEYPHLVDRVNNIQNHPTPALECINICKEMLRDMGIDPESEEAKGKPEPSEGEGDEGKGQPGKDSLLTPAEAEALNEMMEKLGMDVHAIKSEHSDEEHEDYELPEADWYGEYIPYPPENILHEYPDTDDKRPARCKTFDRKHKATQAVGYRVARLFQTAAQTGVEFQQKRGRITPRHLTRGALGDPRVFSRKAPRIDNQAATYLLCDLSGSMAGEKLTAMVAAVGNLSYALQVAGVPFKVAGFTEEEPYCYQYIIKDWKDMYSWEVMRDRFASVNLSQNADGDNLMHAFNELTGRVEKRKILIVLSDGQPCADRQGDVDTYVKNVTKYIEGSGAVELYGVGIMTRAVTKYYNDHVVLNNSNEIEECLTQVVKSKLIRGL